MKAKKFFLTFPQVPTDTLSDFKESKHRILESQSIKNGIIARDKHENGNTHFYVCLEYNNPRTIIRSDYFDFIFDHHGKYETCKTELASINVLPKVWIIISLETSILSLTRFYSHSPFLLLPL